MRILRIEAPDEGYAVEFHPYVTVVAGLTDEQRTALGQAFQSAITGRPPALGGLIEVHGVVLDLDGESLELLELDEVDVDAVVEVRDLPGAASVGLDRQLRAAERRLESLELPYREQSRAVEAAEAALEAASVAMDAARDVDGADADQGAVEELERAVREAEASLAALAEPASRAAGELEQAERALAELGAGDVVDEGQDGATAARPTLEDRRAELVDALDPRAVGSFEEALAALRRVENELAEARSTDDVPEADELASSTGPGGDDETAVPDTDDPAAVEARIEELRGLLALHASYDPSEVRAALDAVRLTPSVGELVPSPEAIGLADRLEATERRVTELEATARHEPPATEAAEAAAAALEEIRAETLELERATEPSTLEADIAELERAHAEVVEARERLEGRMGRARAQTRYDAAVAAEDAVLDRLGIRSYTDFMTGGRVALHSEAEPIELRRLRRREREAEEELQAVQARARIDVDLRGAGQDLREIRGRARTLLGDAEIPDEDLVRALLALRVPAASATPHDELLDALEAVGLPARWVELTRADAEAMAADWLDEYHRAEERKASLEEQLAVLEAGSSVAEEHADPVVIVPEEPLEASPPAADLPEGTPEDRLAAAQDAVRSAKERMIAHESAARELAELDVELEALEGVEGQRGLHRSERDAAERRLEDARAEMEAIDERRNAAEATVLERRAALEQHVEAAAARLEEVARVAEAEADLAGAHGALQAARSGFDAARSSYDAAVEEVAALRQALADVSEEPAPVEEIEWYLLARLAAQRQVSFAGSVPIIIDRALDALDDESVEHVLDRLERMAGAVQVVHLSDDDRVLRWAGAAGEDRAAVVRPIVASVAD